MRIERIRAEINSFPVDMGGVELRKHFEGKSDEEVIKAFRKTGESDPLNAAEKLARRFKGKGRRRIQMIQQSTATAQA